METDKSKGIWNYNNSSYLDDVAYQLYLNNYKPLMYDNVNVATYVSQEDFIIINNSISLFNSHYNNAKLILRKEKIENILNHGDR